MNGKRIQTLTLAIIFLLQISAGVFAQEPQTPAAPETTQTAPAATPTPADSADAAKSSTDIRNFWELSKIGGNIAYVIIFVFAVGLFAIVAKTWELVADGRNARPLSKTNFADLGLANLRDKVEKSKDSNLKELLLHLFDFVDAGGRTNEIQQEIMVFNSNKQERFESYRNWLHFLSDSAGALGLLGTVWGVFSTFFGGNLDNEKILDGMGAALITTLFGLVVSLIINLGNTKLFSSFNKKLEKLTEKGDELRFLYARLKPERQAIPDGLPAAPAQAAASTATNNGSQEMMRNLLVELKQTLSEAVASGSARRDKPERRQASEVATNTLVLAVDEAPTSTISAGETLHKGLKLHVTEHDEPAPQIKIVLQTEGEIYLDGKQRRTEKMTDKHGRVAINLTAGENAGIGEITYWIDGHEEDTKSISVNIEPARPENILVHNGNFQMGRIGQKLPHALQVLVKDRYGNSVPNTEILFRMMHGEGLFNGGQQDYTTITDTHGVAEAEFSINGQPGARRVEALIKANKSKTAEFDIMGAPTHG